MAGSSISYSGGIGSVLYMFTQLTATPVPVGSGATTIYRAQLDGRNIAQATLRLFDKSTTPTVGTDAAWMFLPFVPGEIAEFVFDITHPVTSNNCYAAVTSNPGGGAGSTDPTARVDVIIDGD